jgi:hypothetical protein
MLLKQIKKQFTLERLGRKFPRIKKRPHLGFQTSGKRFSHKLKGKDP